MPMKIKSTPSRGMDVGIYILAWAVLLLVAGIIMLKGYGYIDVSDLFLTVFCSVAIFVAFEVLVVVFVLRLVFTHAERCGQD